MNNGFSILELLLALTLSMTILTMVISSVTEGVSVSKKVTTNQDVLESLFFTVDSIKNDLTKCGMRLQEAIKLFNLKVISNSQRSFTILYGISSTSLLSDSYQKDNFLQIADNEFIKKRQKLLLYDPELKNNMICTVKEKKKNEVILNRPLQNDFIKSSPVIVLKEIEYKYFPKQKVLKKKVNLGYFQPLIENVTDFFVAHFPDSNSILYRIEIGNREQVRGYIFLSNLAG